MLRLRRIPMICLCFQFIALLFFFCSFFRFYGIVPSQVGVVVLARRCACGCNLYNGRCMWGRGAAKVSGDEGICGLDGGPRCAEIFVR
jgi:hypothetical protein